MSAQTMHSTDTTNNAGVPPAPPEAHQRADFHKPRGLDIRASYALAKVLFAAFADEASELALAAALQDAEALGHNDFRHGILCVPTMFRGEADLMAAWWSGQALANLYA